jgi:hypothetical protein
VITIWATEESSQQIIVAIPTITLIVAVAVSLLISMASRSGMLILFIEISTVTIHVDGMDTPK